MNQLSASFVEYLENTLIEQGFSSGKINNISPAYGGSINQTYSFKTTVDSFFIKINDSRFPDMFKKEKLGLELLREFSKELIIPKPLYEGEHEHFTFLVMELINSSTSSSPSKTFWAQFSKGLARLHKNSAPSFGLEYDNYIGSLQQINQQKNNWADFFIENRLMTQEKMAVDNGLLDKQMRVYMSKLYLKIDQLFPDEPPALLHGDLWSGNFMVSNNGEPCIFDPAIYYGHREMDIAMMHLFGGFDRELFESYHAILPLEKDWEKRIELCNLYPLLVHVNLFGSSYSVRVKSILRQIVG